MNYLSHYVWNHEVRGLPRAPYFAMGVALPDLWSRFSRTRRIRWAQVRATAPTPEPARALRDGLLNHVDADRRFHALPVFIRWMRTIKSTARDADAVHPALLDFLAHVALELALDRRLLERDDSLAIRFYRDLSDADALHTEQLAADITGVDTRGLAQIVQAFLARRFVLRYRCDDGLCDILQRVLRLTSVPIAAPADLVRETVRAACALAEPDAVWRELAAPVEDVA